MHRASGRLWDPGPDLADRYRGYLGAMHCIIRASVPLMELAAVRCAALPGDPVTAPLAGYLHRHIEEERGHDDWLLADAARAGTDPERLLRATPPPAVAQLVGAQYYWIEHYHPVALLGYLIALEGNAPASWLADRLAGLTGLPPAAFDTVRRHADLDGGHRADLDRLLDRLPLTAGQLSAVAVSALHTIDAVAGLFVRLAENPEIPGNPGAPESPGDPDHFDHAAGGRAGSADGSTGGTAP
nr:iron-containing redox enzyme family protein [Streptomyces sp. YIM 98790]